MGLQGSRVQIPPSRFLLGRPLGRPCRWYPSFHLPGVRMRPLSLLPFLAILAACSPRKDAGAGSGGFSAELGVDTTSMTKAPSGLWYTDVAVGQGGEAETGRTLSVDYKGGLPNGKKFGSTPDCDEPFGFTRGAG